jgi:glutamine amidotransferase
VSRMRPAIAVLDYGMGNIRSVVNAIQRVGGRAVVTSTDHDGSEEKTDAAVLPGVGAFGACMSGLKERGLDRTVVAFSKSSKPMLGVCLGMQVLFGSSEEDPGAGLEYFPGTVRRLPDSVKVPHMGWNNVTWTGTHPLMEGIPSGTSFYFVHSYAPEPDSDHTIGVTEYGTAFAAVVAKDALFATQFHPEKSGDAGLQIYQNLVKAAA